MDFLDYYYGGKKGSKTLGAPEESYLYSSSQAMSPDQSYIGGQEMSTDMASNSGGAASGASGAAGMGAMAGGPAGAAASVGGQFLMNYLNQRAADRRQQQANAVKIEQDYANNQNNAFNSLGNHWRGALR